MLLSTPGPCGRWEPKWVAVPPRLASRLPHFGGLPSLESLPSSKADKTELRMARGRRLLVSMLLCTGAARALVSPAAISRRFRSASIADRGQGRTPVLRAPDRKCARRTLSHRSGEGERTSAPGTSRLDGAHAYQTFRLYAVPYFYWPVLALMLGALIYTWSLSGERNKAHARSRARGRDSARVRANL